jgi:hypothetical protein
VAMLSIAAGVDRRDEWPLSERQGRSPV